MAGWPWPLDAVQGWFEGLWFHVTSAAEAAVSVVQGWINSALVTLSGWLAGGWAAIRGWVDNARTIIGTWVAENANRVISWITNVGATLETAVSQAAAGLQEYILGISDQISGFLTDVGAVIQTGLSTGLNFLREKVGEMLSSLKTKIVEVAETIGDGVNAGIHAISSQLSDTGSWIVESVGHAFDGASTAIGDTLGSIFKDPLGAIGAFFKTFLTGFGVINIDSVSSSTLTILAGVQASLAALLRAGSPMTPEEAYSLSTKYAWEMRDHWYQLYIISLIVEGASLGQVDTVGTMILQEPQIASALDLAKEWFAMPYKFGVSIRAQQFWLSVSEPMIPPAPDLINMVVREAFDPEQVVKAPALFAHYMRFAGFSVEWSDRYWTAHFVRASVGIMEENFRRGYLSEEALRKWFIIADIHPGDHDAIMRQIYGPPTRLDLRQGYAARVYDREDLVTFLRMRRLSPADAEMAAEAIIKYLLRDEITKLAKASEDDVVDDLISLDEHRANLDALEMAPEEVDYRVEYARHRRSTALLRLALKTSRTQFLKGAISEDRYRQDLLGFGIGADRAEAIIKDAAALKKKQIRDTVAEKKRRLTKATIDKARELGLISDPDYVDRLLAADYDPDDARLMLQIELTPRPVTLEEIERRRRSILSKRNRAVRRFEAQLLRITQQIESTTAQREDVEVIKAESLDVYQEEIDYITEILPTLPDEEAEKRRRRRAAITARMEAAEARFNARLEALTRQILDLTETKALVEKQRDVELGEYDAELKFIGAVA